MFGSRFRPRRGQRGARHGRAASRRLFRREPRHPGGWRQRRVYRPGAQPRVGYASVVWGRRASVEQPARQRRAHARLPDPASAAAIPVGARVRTRRRNPLCGARGIGSCCTPVRGFYGKDVFDFALWARALVIPDIGLCGSLWFQVRVRRSTQDAVYPPLHPPLARPAAVRKIRLHVHSTI